ncbi:MAG: hypothetical protein HOV81_22975 [Kofleriaceae bacterium]|nr:hypothetical protein [Kofleriaceae bacterium]
MAPGLPAKMAIVCAVLAIAAAGEGRARAERRPVAVVSLSEDADASLLANDLYRALVNHPELQPLPDLLFNPALQGPFFGTVGAKEFDDQLARARLARSDADAALKLARPDFRTAESAARRGTQALGEVAPTSEMLALYADLVFDLGQAQLIQGKSKDANESFTLVHRLDPSKRPDPARYLPEIIDAYNATAPKGGRLAKLLVKGMGRVWIDGIEQKLGANNMFEVDEGLHLVQLTGPEREPRGELVHVPQAAEIEIAPALATEDLKVKRARVALAQVQDPVSRASAIRRLAQLLHVNDAVVIWRSPQNKLLVQTWRHPEPGFSAIKEHGNEKALDLLAPLAPPREVEPIETDPVVPPILVEKKWYQKRWVKASAVASVLAIAATVVFVSTRDRMLGPFNSEIQER